MPVPTPPTRCSLRGEGGDDTDAIIIERPSAVLGRGSRTDPRPLLGRGSPHERATEKARTRIDILQSVDFLPPHSNPDSEGLLLTYDTMLLGVDTVKASDTSSTFSMTTLAQPLVFAHTRGLLVLGVELPLPLSPKRSAVLVVERWTALAWGAAASSTTFMLGRYIDGPRIGVTVLPFRAAGGRCHSYRSRATKC